MDEDETETNTPAVETPVVETPVVETPVVETPVVETPVVETPAVETPVIPDGYVKAEEVETERTARTAAEARAIAAEARARANEIKLAAQALNFNDPSDAERFIGADVEDIPAALAEVLKTKSYLAKQTEAPAPPPVTPTSPTNPPRADAPLTVETIKGMSREQVALNWQAVKAALAANK
jgi:ribonuclease E